MGHISFGYVNDVNLLSGSKEVDLEVRAEETKNMFMSSHQIVGQNYDIKTV
jgi:hypothetical protein